jgi:tetratricopeptide (TPR) repeat protein
MALHREEEAQALMEKYQKIRPQRFPGVRKYQGMIELATLSAPELRTREIERFRRDAREHPDHPEYQLHLASLLLAHGQQDEALREFQLLLTRNANSQVWEEAGSMLLTAHEYQLAREFLQRAVAERPSARLDLAIALFYQEGAESALESLDKNPAGKPTGDELLLRANLLEAAGKKAEAENMLAEGLRQTSTKPEVVRPAVLLLQRLGRKIEAMRLLEQAIPANPQDSDLPLTRAILLGLLGEFAPAEKAFREIELRWPEWDRVYLAHGILLEKSGHPTEARQKLQLARTLGAQEPALKCALARLADKSPPTEECACHAGLEQLLSPGCGR